LRRAMPRLVMARGHGNTVVLYAAKTRCVGYTMIFGTAEESQWRQKSRHLALRSAHPLSVREGYFSMAGAADTGTA
jgi:hypothetical protein